MRYVATVIGLWAVTATAVAQAPLAPGDDYDIDMVQTPVLGSGRIVGLGGAYTALADGIDGAPWNPAAYGSRTLWELDWFEWELTAGVLFPGSFADNDFFNRDTDGFLFDDFYFVTFGFRLQLGDVGLGAIPRVQLYRLGDVDVSFVVGSYGIAFQLWDAQVVVGVGARTADLTISDAVTGRELWGFTGSGPEFGALLKPAGRPWRVGVAARTPVVSDDLCDDCTTAEGFVLPQYVRMPWELQVGIAVQLGDRPLNRRWVDPEIAERAVEDEVTMAQWERERDQVAAEMQARGEPAPPRDPYRWLPRRASDPAFWQREQALRAREDASLDERVEAVEEAADRAIEELPREYLLLTADVLVTGRVSNGVGIEGFLAQRRIRSGDEITYSIRFGVETEPWRGRLKVRAGTYLEPSRFDTGSYRLHGTAGVDLRLFRWDVFGLFDDFDVRVGLTGDVAARYFDWGLGVGFWH